jgi:hypothetical protein
MSSQQDLVYQICSVGGHSALDCLHLEAVAAARAVSRATTLGTDQRMGSASAQLVNYGSITINRIRGSRKGHGPPHNTLVNDLHKLSSERVQEPLAPVAGGSRSIIITITVTPHMLHIIQKLITTISLLMLLKNRIQGRSLNL